MDVATRVGAALGKEGERRSRRSSGRSVGSVWRGSLDRVYVIARRWVAERPGLGPTAEDEANGAAAEFLDRRAPARAQRRIITAP